MPIGTNQPTTAHTPTTTIHIYSQPDAGSCTTTPPAFPAFPLPAVTNNPDNLYRTTQSTFNTPPCNLIRPHVRTEAHLYKPTGTHARMHTTSTITKHKVNTHRLLQCRAEDSQIQCSKHATSCAAHSISRNMDVHHMAVATIQRQI